MKSKYYTKQRGVAYQATSIRVICLSQRHQKYSYRIHFTPSNDR